MEKLPVVLKWAAMALGILAVLVAGVKWGVLKQDSGTAEKAAFCGWSTGGECSSDEDCTVGGCSSQVCMAESEGGMVTTCEWRNCYDADAYDLSCKCVGGECRWSSGDGEAVCTDQDTGAGMSWDEARELAQNSECAVQGTLTEEHTCNPVTGTWWVGLEPAEPAEGCNPACVVDVNNATAVVNWRCTGLAQ